MRILITGAAGNLGSFLAKHMLDGPHELRLMVHRRPLPFAVGPFPNVSICRADLGDPATLADACQQVDAIVHFAGVLFAPHPERFLPATNTDYVRNLTAAALETGVGKFVLISFPHVEGESTPEHPATGRLDGRPHSVHARTRLAAERNLLAACEGLAMAPVVLRPGMIYGRGLLMIEAARWLLRRRMLCVWKKPTWIHLLSLPDFHAAVVTALESPNTGGVVNLGDNEPITLQYFLDTLSDFWDFHRPRRCPDWSFHLAAWCCETYASLFRTAAPLTRDFIRIGMASYVSDTTRMKQELLPQLAYPTLREGMILL
jgi:nucleoside-diphosphate-sugar epimerase